MPWRRSPRTCAHRPQASQRPPGGNTQHPSYTEKKRSPESHNQLRVPKGLGYEHQFHSNFQKQPPFHSFSLFCKVKPQLPTRPPGLSVSLSFPVPSPSSKPRSVPTTLADDPRPGQRGPFRPRSWVQEGHGNEWSLRAPWEADQNTCEHGLQAE